MGKPLAKVGRERIKVEIEPITRKEGETAGSQEVSESVDEMLCHVLCSGAERVSPGGSSCEDRWPATTTTPAENCAASCAVHPTVRAGAGDCRKSACATSERAR